MRVAYLDADADAGAGAGAGWLEEEAPPFAPLPPLPLGSWLEEEAPPFDPVSVCEYSVRQRARAPRRGTLW